MRDFFPILLSFCDMLYITERRSVINLKKLVLTLNRQEIMFFIRTP